MSKSFFSKLQINYTGKKSTQQKNHKQTSKYTKNIWTEVAKMMQFFSGTFFPLQQFEVLSSWESFSGCEL